MKSNGAGMFGWHSFLFLFCLGLSGGAQAHDLATAGAGLAQGFAHPFSGVDHLLAMIAVGVWAVQQRGRARWALPASFVAMMAVGAALNLFGGVLPGTDAVILGSLLALGLLIGFSVRPAPWLAAGLVGFFALFHGYAHGAALP